MQGANKRLCKNMYKNSPGNLITKFFKFFPRRLAIGEN